MRISTTLALALGLAAGVGACKKDKKKDDQPVVQPDKGSGSAGGMMASGSGAAPVAEKPLEGEALAKRYIECGNMMAAGDMDKFGSTCVAEGFKAHSAAMGMDMTKSDMLAMMKDMKSSFSDMKFEPQMIFVNGRTVAAVALNTGTNTGPMKMGDHEMPKTDKKIGMMMFHRLKMDDTNKATDEWEISDMGTFMAQLGMGSKEMAGRPLMEKGMDGAPQIIVAANDDKEKANLAVVQKGNDAFNAHKVADMMAVMADDVVESDLADDKDHAGKAEVQKGTEMFVKAFPDGKVEAKEIWAAGDYVVMIARFTGTNDGPLGPMPKTGKKVDVELAEISQLKDGKIVKMWRFRDNMSFAQQLGLIKDDMGGGAGSGAEPVAKPKEK